MGWKSNVVVASSVIALGTGVLGYLEPPTDTSRTRDQQMQQQVGDLSDNQDRLNEDRRREGNELGNSTYRDSLGSSEVRPREKLPEIHLRIRP